MIQTDATKEVLRANVMNLLTAYSRDTDLSEDQLESYRKADLLCEPFYTDISVRSKGLTGNTRFVIFTNRAQHLQLFDTAPTWGLFTCPPNSLFKVLGVRDEGDKHLVMLLHLPDDPNYWKLFRGRLPIEMDEYFMQGAEESFRENCRKEPLKDLCNPDWLERCAFAIGMDEKGVLAPLP